MTDRVYHWKHGWIPLDHAAAMSHAKGDSSSASKMLDVVKREHLSRDSHVIVATRTGKTIAVHDDHTGHSVSLSSEVAASMHDKGHHITGVESGGRVNTRTPDGHAHALDKHGSQQVGPNDAEKIKAAEIMFGTGSKQHLAAIKRFGSKKQRR